ncbi:MAG TPA: DUF58 domain-containing protein, partial [Candidatus Wallbacteria bacterium]|nr:DUF58 domain-containing protein [Candidatus Wallbacteria bacterium]
ETEFVGLENDGRLVTNVEMLRNDYKLVLNGFIEDFKRRCAQSYIDYNLVSIDTPIDKALSTYLVKRARR